MANDANSWNREIFWLRATLAVALLSFLIAVWQVFDARANKESLAHELQSKQTDLNKAQTDNDALLNLGFPGFLQKYDAHIAELKSASDTYEKAKTAKGVNISGSEAANALIRAANELTAASDSFTDFTKLWREVAEVFNKMLDGNATQLENARRENNIADADTTARRIVKAAPDLAAPLRVALDKLKPTAKK